MDLKFLLSLSSSRVCMATSGRIVQRIGRQHEITTFCIQISRYLHTWCVLLPHDDQKQESLSNFANFPNLKKTDFPLLRVLSLGFAFMKDLTGYSLILPLIYASADHRIAMQMAEYLFRFHKRNEGCRFT